MIVITQLVGGLGNQLFQYACGRQLSYKYSIPLKLDLTNFTSYKLHAYSLTHFKINATVASAQELSSFPPLSPRKTIIQKLNGFFTPRASRLIERHFHFMPAVMDVRPPVYLQGYWQSEKYFHDIAEIIRADCTIATPPDNANHHLGNAIRNCTAVSVHVRRGDYVSNAKTNSVHGTCDVAYYQRAVQEIRNKVSSPHFFVFSDDPHWARTHLTFDWNPVFVNHNEADRNYEDLRLMTLCKHHIIANSSFSWWGAWLGTNPGKIVIAPKRWFATSKIDDRDLVPTTWQRL